MSPGATGDRRRARERALSLLYEADRRGQDPSEVVAAQPTPPEAFAAELVDGVAEHRVELDDAIARHARGWTLDRMPVVDRALLRLAAFELLHRPDVPTGVVLSEAVDLAAAYSTDESSGFVNGVLAALATDVRGDATP